MENYDETEEHQNTFPLAFFEKDKRDVLVDVSLLPKL